MLTNNLNDKFRFFCREHGYEINKHQIKIIYQLNKFINPTNSILNYIFQSKKKSCFYLQGNVGVGKTMIANFIYDQVSIKKTRLHFNEFMINFHDFRHHNKNDNSIITFVKNLKVKYDLIYLDEFQVTNIVDAMILGKLFEIIFLFNIKVIITTNTKLVDLYKDGLQREKFLPFISILAENSIQKELLVDDDYRLQMKNKFKRIFFPINEKSTFRINKIFRELTRNKIRKEKIINTKGRCFKINDYFEGVVKFNFNDLCNKNLGAEDYINIANECKHVIIQKIPVFDDLNSNQQLRFITLIDIFYEKKILLTLSLQKELKKLSLSKRHFIAFKRTLSRLNEMTANY
jgi:cell division protein ZapE